MLFQIIVQCFTYSLVYGSHNFAVSELRLGLAFKLRLRELHAEHGGQPFADVVAGKGLPLHLLNQIGLALDVVIDGAGQRGLEPGKVLSFNYDVGDKVGQGAVLFTVDSTDLQNNMRSLQASYNAAKLGRDNAKSTYDSNKLLYDEEIISKNEFDQIKYAYESADAQLASIQVQMDNLKKNISDCTVTSPMTGVIATRGVEKGSFASQAAPAYTVMDLSTIKVEVSVSEQVLNTIQVGDKVSVLMTAASETPLTGTVATIAPAAEQTGMYTVKVELDNKDGKIKSGMMAEVSFTMAASDDTILLPRNAVIEKDNETYVYVINNGKAKKTAVELGIEAEDTIEIKSGLKKGDNVVTKGQTYLSDGEEVTIANTAAKTKEKTKTTEKGE